MIALCPGSFDPVHHGHLEIIARAAQLFDKVIVGVAHNSSKKYRFSLEERVQLVRESLQELGIEGVSVEPIPPGVLLAEYAAERGAKVLVKGLRSATDYSYEAPMASMNRHLAQVETVFLAGEDRYGAVSSTIIREVASLGGDVTPFVPEAVARALKNA
ncbi:pantetheine-phosphate adenylyltransferase [Rothia sp. HMSC072B04]|jgi:pantetheine-phosphate adenylyltransferase|uniref:pantetheine-phosphate adenylyltransferase n=1 Tax=Rothia TaxID=32207 RepID=UPI0008A36A4D|nr:MULTISPECIES: pantetheine-phosphate adenylyltransferase [Rothia]OFQ59150.1 pantetheine-phosphate adenylyltransferase [Rothia sp. HMSC072B04]